MSKRPRNNGRKRRGGPSRPAEPDFIDDIASALASGDPLALLGMSSTLIEGLNGADDVPGVDDLVDSLLEVPLVETSALLTALAELSMDEVLRKRVQREVGERGHMLPTWLRELHRATGGERAAEIAHVLGDGDNVFVSVSAPGAGEITAVVYVDHNLGTVVKDAFLVPGPLDDVVGQAVAAAEGDPDLTVRPLSPADARARVEDAVEAGAMQIDPVQTETWPSCRPVLQWILGRLPAGGTAYEWREWDEGEVAALAERFRASPFAVDDPADLVSALLLFGVQHGDPLRWSPVVAEIVMLDWVPRTLVAAPELLAGLPDVLRAFIRFSHHERGVRRELTDETITAVDTMEPEYQGLIADDQRPDLVAGMNAFLLDELAHAVGGMDALDALDTDPLPDEDVDWEPVPEDVRDRVAEVVDLVDEFCDARLTPEFRTACRRLLADVAAADPAIFRRRGRAATAAATVCWLIGKNNDLFDGASGPLRMTVKDLTARFGVAGNSLSQRAEAFMKAVGADPHGSWQKELGSPRYLIGARRAHIVEERDHILTGQ